MPDAVTAMEDELGLVRDSARSLAARLRDHAALRSGRNTLPWYQAAQLPAMAELGCFGTLIPAAQGGLELGLETLAAIAQEFGAALLGEPLLPFAVLGPRAILLGDNATLKADLLPRLAEGTAYATLAWQEESADPTAIACRARPDGSGWVLQGRKRFIAGAWGATDLVVSARTDRGPVLLHLPMPAERMTMEWRADGSPAGMLVLDGLRAEALVAGPDHATAVLAAVLDEAAIIAAAELCGINRATLAMTHDYLRTRTAFGRPIGAFQALQHRAADLHVQQEIAGASLLAALRATLAERPLAASRAKARCGEAAMLVTRQAIQLHGGIGFTDACDIGLYLKRAMVLAAMAGSSLQHRARLATALDQLLATPAEAATTASRLAEYQALPVAERDWPTLDEAAFRACARDFFDSRLPRELRFIPRRLGWAEIGDWYLTMSREGWLAPTWPARHGGMGLTSAQLIIYFEEMERVGAPRLLDHGINNVGSILLACGTEWQRDTYLPKILSGEHIWCQGYSEPNAGSDLASLRTEAKLEGEEFIVTGQKIWTTLAHQATHIYALVRTNKARPGREGISFLLIDLRQPGVTIRPIRNIAGHDEFCEVFLDGVRTPRANLVGALNDGWAVSRAVLGFERLRVGAPRNATLALQRLLRVASRTGLDNEPLIRDRLARLACDVLDLGALYEVSAAAMRAGRVPGPETSVLKILATETEQRATEMLVDILGDAGIIAGPQPIAGQEVDVLTPFLSTRATTIYGGTNEIQRNIIARRILGL